MVFGVLVSCNTELTKSETQNYTSKGKEVAGAVFKELSKNLQDQMKLGGTVQAIPYCNITAMPITSELADHYKVSIKRTSDRIRNPKNLPIAREKQILEIYHKAVAEKSELKPMVEKVDGLVTFYAPIKIQKNCLVCHGVVSESVTVATDSILKSLYPDDKAKGYNEGDLKGIWSISFRE